MPRLKKVLSIAVLFGVIGISLPNQIGKAQDTITSCENLLTRAIQAIQNSCNGLTPGNACTPSGSKIALADVSTLQTTALDLKASQWDSTLIKIPAGDQPIALALFGGAAITNTTQAAVPTPEPLIATNKSGYNVNMRQGPGKDFDVAGFFGWDKTANVDGRSADGKWLRLQIDSGFAWISSDLVSLSGDAAKLPILSGDAGPMQQFTLNTPEESACGAGASGLLVSHTGANDVNLQVNGANLTFDVATLLLQASPNHHLEIYVIDGQAGVDADGQKITAKRGETAEVALGGADGLVASAAPLVKPSYPFNTIIGMPLELVSDSHLACTAGLIDGDINASSFTEPKNDANVSGLLVMDAHYLVLGQMTDEQGNPWWRLDGGWVRQDTVQVAGACDAIAEVSANTSAAATNNMSTNSGASVALFSTALVPTGETIWSADPGHDILTGTCVLPPLPVCPHPTAITPNGASLSWRGQEPLPYSLRLTGDNSYAFNGRNNLNNANYTMSLTFTSTSTWTMTMTQVFDSDPGCTHTLYYNAVPR
ncbi:MAG: SH3 domain-containing protein [Chloroflexota bacterium]